MPREYTIERGSAMPPQEMERTGSLQQIKSLEGCWKDRFDKNRLLVLKEFVQHFNQMTKGDED